MKNLFSIMGKQNFSKEKEFTQRPYGGSGVTLDDDMELYEAIAFHGGYGLMIYDSLEENSGNTWCPHCIVDSSDQEIFKSFSFYTDDNKVEISWESDGHSKFYLAECCHAVIGTGGKLVGDKEKYLDNHITGYLGYTLFTTQESLLVKWFNCDKKLAGKVVIKLPNSLLAELKENNDYIIKRGKIGRVKHQIFVAYTVGDKSDNDNFLVVQRRKKNTAETWECLGKYEGNWKIYGNTKVSSLCAIQKQPKEFRIMDCRRYSKDTCRMWNWEIDACDLDVCRVYMKNNSCIVALRNTKTEERFLYFVQLSNWDNSAKCIGCSEIHKDDPIMPCDDNCIPLFDPTNSTIKFIDIEKISSFFQSKMQNKEDITTRTSYLFNEINNSTDENEERLLSNEALQNISIAGNKMSIPKLFLP